MEFREKRTTLRPLLFLILFSILCMGSMVLVADEMCHRNITRRQPLYPDAQRIEHNYNFLRSQGMGITRMTLETDDDEETVREWMRQVALELLEAEAFGGIATVSWRYEAISEDADSGTRIYLYSECAQ